VNPTQNSESCSLNSTENPTKDNLFYHHHGDNPGAILVQTPLMCDNYKTLSRSMEITLTTKNKFKMVDGSSPMPPITLANHKAWKKCNNMVKSLIVNSFRKGIVVSILYINNVEDV
jgi:hypothetical protein